MSTGDDAVARAAVLRRMTLGEVEEGFQRGSVSEDEFAGYRWAWATSTVRHGQYESWCTPPGVERARRCGELLSEEAAR